MEMLPQLPEFLSRDRGSIRLAGHRISLFHFLSPYNDGFSAEMLLEQFPTLSMELIHHVLAFYWGHKSAVDEYMEDCVSKQDALEARTPSVDIARIRTRIGDRQASVAKAS